MKRTVRCAQLWAGVLAVPLLIATACDNRLSPSRFLTTRGAPTRETRDQCPEPIRLFDFKNRSYRIHPLGEVNFVDGKHDGEAGISASILYVDFARLWGRSDELAFVRILGNWDGGTHLSERIVVLEEDRGTLHALEVIETPPLEAMWFETGHLDLRYRIAGQTDAEEGSKPVDLVELWGWDGASLVRVNTVEIEIQGKH